MTTPYKFNLYLSNGITKFKYIDERDKPLIDGEYDGLGIYKDTNEYIRLKIICKNKKLILKRVIKEYFKEIENNKSSNFEKIILNKNRKKWLNNITLDEINYVNNIIKETTNFEEWFPFVFEKDKIINIGFNYTALKGKIQSSKSTAIRAFSLGCYIMGIPTIIVTKNATQDVIQLVDGWKNINNNIYKKYKEKFNKNFEKINIVKGSKNSIKKNTKLYVDILNGKNSGIIITMANVYQIGSILDLIKNKLSNIPPFVLIIDEVDKVNHQNDKENTNENNVYFLLEELSNLSLHTVGISATMFDVLFEESRLKPDRMFNLPIPKYYRDINQVSTGIDIRIIDDETYIPKKIKSIKAPKNYDEYEINDCIINYYETLSVLPPHKLNINIDGFDFHPINVLHVDSKQTINHRHNYKWITTNPKTKNFSAIIYDQVKKVYSPELIDKFPSFAMENSKDGHFLCKPNTTIREIYSVLRNAGATHIVCFSGYLASRGINFTNDTYTMQLTNQYFIPSKNENWAELYQGLRMLGVHKYTSFLPMMLYTHENVWNELIKGYWIQEDIYNNIKNENSEIDVPTYMQNIIIHKNKKIKRKLGKKKTNLLKIGMNGEKTYGMDINEFEKKIDISAAINKEYMKYNPCIELINIDDESDIETVYENDENEIVESLKEIGKDEFKRIINMFEKWNKDNSTKISIFMQNLNPLKNYKEIEMKKLCKETGIKDISHLMNFKRGISQGYGMILQKKENMYKLQPCLINEFNKYF